MGKGKGKKRKKKQQQAKAKVAAQAAAGVEQLPLEAEQRGIVKKKEKVKQETQVFKDDDVDDEAWKAWDKHGLEILELISASQAQNGLRNSDYTRYRQYCQRRIHRIRKSLNFQNGRRTFQKRNVKAKHVKDVRFLTIPLLNAERAWSYAMELEKINNEEDLPRKRVHMVRRLKKACKHARDLVSLCDSRSDAKTRLEANAYSAWLHGTLNLKAEDYEPSLKYFTKARLLFEKLQSLGDRSRGLYQDKISEISELLQVVEYNLGDYINEVEVDTELPADQNAAFEEVQKALLASKANENVDSVEWKGRAIPLRSNKLSDFMARIKRSHAAISGESNDRRRLSLYTKLFITLEEAITYIREDTAQLLSSQVRTQVTAMKQEHLEALAELFTFEKLKLIIDRYALVLADLSRHLFGLKVRRRNRGKPIQLASICEKSIAALHEMGSVLDLGRDKTMGQEITVSSKSFQALRAFHIAQHYFDQKRYEEACALFTQAETSLAEATSQATQMTWKTLANPNQVGAFTKLATRNKLLSRANGILRREEEEEDATAGIERMSVSDQSARVRYLLERLDEFDSGNRDNFYDLIEFPVQKLRPIPMKPIFFDIAADHIAYPNLAERVPKASGGMLAGWFG